MIIIDFELISKIHLTFFEKYYIINFVKDRKQIFNLIWCKQIKPRYVLNKQISGLFIIVKEINRGEQIIRRTKQRGANRGDYTLTELYTSVTKSK